MIVFGNGEFAQVMRSNLGAEFSGFTVHREFMKGDEIPFEELEKSDIVIAVGHGHRGKVFEEVFSRKHRIRSWISNHALADVHTEGVGIIVLEGNNLQAFSHIGHNTVLWAGNHIGHHSRVGNHCFITSHVCIGGGAEIGDYCFIGMNATVFDHVKIGTNCTIAAGAVADRDIPDNHTLSRKGVLVANAVG